MIDLFFQFISFNGYLKTWQECACFWVLALIFFHIPIMIYKKIIKKEDKK